SRPEETSAFQSKLIRRAVKRSPVTTGVREARASLREMLVTSRARTFAARRGFGPAILWLSSAARPANLFPKRRTGSIRARTPRTEGPGLVVASSLARLRSLGRALMYGAG